MGVMSLDKMEKFLKLILEERFLMTCYSSKMALLRFYIAVRAGLLGLFHGIRLAQVALPLDFLVPWPQTTGFLLLGVHTGCCLCPTFVRTCWEDMSCYRYNYTSCGYKYLGHFRSFLYGDNTMQCFI